MIDVATVVLDEDVSAETSTQSATVIKLSNSLMMLHRCVDEVKQTVYDDKATKVHTICII
uniref:Uncharacterized protein n=1 Tax=Arion vulgaris TaxID=1028688 RepID=A0A0B6Y1J8_9EUPU